MTTSRTSSYSSPPSFSAGGDAMDWGFPHGCDGRQDKEDEADFIGAS
jgi:hypothetical protein